MSITLRHAIAAAAAISALLSATAVTAAGAYHPAAGEAGATYHPEHANSATRDQVNADLNNAIKLPNWQTAMSRGAPWPVARSAPLSREQVKAELQTAMQSPDWDRVGRGGGSWPAGGLRVQQSTAR